MLPADCWLPLTFFLLIVGFVAAAARTHSSLDCCFPRVGFFCSFVLIARLAQSLLLLCTSECFFALSSTHLRRTILDVPMIASGYNTPAAPVEARLFLLKRVLAAYFCLWLFFLRSVFAYVLISFRLASRGAPSPLRSSSCDKYLQAPVTAALVSTMLLISLSAPPRPTSFGVEHPQTYK